jgi:hypothetical protein
MKGCTTDLAGPQQWSRQRGNTVFNDCGTAVDGGDAMKWFAACLVFALAWFGAACACRAAAKPAAASAQSYAVIRVGVELQVIPKSSWNQAKKSASDKYKADMKAYANANKAAAKDPDAPKPTKPTKAVVAMIRSSFKTQAEAEQFRDKYLEEHDREGLTAQKAPVGGKPY